MRAIRYHQFGGPEVLKYEEVPDPTPGPGEVLVATRAISVSPVHWKVATGRGPAKPRLPMIPGSEAAGVTGDGRAVVLAGGGLGTMRDGVYAELFVAPAAALVDMPEGVKFAEAAALGVAYATAYVALVERGALQPGEPVAVLGATGGVGVAGVQIAKLCGASRVVAVARADAAEALRELGADEVVDVESDDLGAAITHATGGGAALILDGVAGKVGSAATGGLLRYGRQVVLGTSAGDRYDFPVVPFYNKSASILGFTLFHHAERIPATVRTLLELVAARRLQVPIDRTLPLARAADAWRHGQSRGKLGKVILTP